MNANELADGLSRNQIYGDDHGLFNKRIQNMLRQQQALIENLNGRIERMIEKQSHYEAMAHAGGFEAGRELGMKQERALWELAASTREIENQTKPAKYSDAWWKEVEEFNKQLQGQDK